EDEPAHVSACHSLTQPEGVPGRHLGDEVDEIADQADAQHPQGDEDRRPPGPKAFLDLAPQHGVHGQVHSASSPFVSSKKSSSRPAASARHSKTSIPASIRSRRMPADSSSPPESTNSSRPRSTTASATSGRASNRSSARSTSSSASRARNLDRQSV